MRKVVNTKEEVKKKFASKENQTTQVKKNRKKVVSENKKIDLRKYFTKVNITYFILLLLDIILVVYSARRNIVNYVVVLDEEIFVSKTRYLLCGRNYVNLVIIVFFYIYICLINKFFLQKKNTKRFLFGLFIGLVILNLLLFALFTKRVY